MPLQFHYFGTLTPGKRPGTHCTGRWVGPRVSINGCKNLASTGFLCNLLFSLCTLPIPVSMSPAGAFLFVFSFTLFVLHPYVSFVLIVLHFAFFILYLPHTTQASVPPAGFEHAIPADADPRLTPLGHWGR